MVTLSVPLIPMEIDYHTQMVQDWTDHFIILQSGSANQLNAVTVAYPTVWTPTQIEASASSNADIVVEPQGTGTVDFKVPAQEHSGISRCCKCSTS
jgi:hypothetical protein